MAAKARTVSAISKFAVNNNSRIEFEVRKGPNGPFLMYDSINRFKVFQDSNLPVTSLGLFRVL